MTPLRTIVCVAAVAALSAAAAAQSRFLPSLIPWPATEAAPLVTPSGKTAPRPSPGSTPQTATMTPQEREQQRQDLERAKAGAECRDKAMKERQEMAQRARERGEPAPPNPASDPCVGR